MLVFIIGLTRRRVRAGVMERFQAKMAPTMAAKSMAETKLTVLLGAPPVLPEEVPVVEVGEGEELVDEEELGVELGSFGVVVVVVVWREEVVEVKELLLESVESREPEGVLTELVEFRQLVVPT